MYLVKDSIVACITVAAVCLPTILKEFEKKYPHICVKSEVMSAVAAITSAPVGKRKGSQGSV